MSKLCTLIATLVVLISSPFTSFAQSESSTVFDPLKETVAAEVVAITDSYTRSVPGTNTDIQVQEITIRFLGGEKDGSLGSFENELAPLEVGDDVFVNRVVDINGRESIVLMDVDRRSELLWLGLLAVTLILFFAGWQGFRALLSLGLSIGAIVFLLLPALLAGYDPALSSLLIAGIVLAVVLFTTHGIHALSLIAFLGTWSAVLVTCIIASFSVGALKLSGFSSDAAVSLNFATDGTLDFAGLLLGSIIIGILGVLDDVSITQASVVQELKAANQALKGRSLYSRAIKVGRDHVGSLVNTLAFAYVGASLPLMLLYARADTNVFISLNQEIFAAEVARIIIGSIGLVLAVPFTTGIAAYYFGKKDQVTAPTHGHSHSHGHD